MLNRAIAPLEASVIGFGLVGAIWPYELARLEKQIDAIGSKHLASAVKPAD